MQTPTTPTYPREHAHKLILGNPESHIGILTLWTPVQSVVETLCRDNFCIAGQLVTKSQGLSAIVRNCLLHGALTDIVVTGNNKTGTLEAIKNLIEFGVDENHAIIGVEHSYIDKEIPREYIDMFRKNMNLHFCDTVSDEFLSSIKRKGRYANPGELIFPDHEIEVPQIYAWEGAVYAVREKTVAKAWIEALYAIQRFGAIKESRHGRQKELMQLTMVISDEDPYNIDWQPYFNFSREDLERYIPEVASGKTSTDLQYTYGSRIFSYDSIDAGIIKKLDAIFEDMVFLYSQDAKKCRDVLDALKAHTGIDQIGKTVAQLKKDKYSRAAYVTLWNPARDALSDNPPCIDMLNFLVEGNRLNLAVWIRSNDIVKAWPMNALALRRLQADVARRSGLELGVLITNSMSAHIYLQDVPVAENAISFRRFDPMALDPRGNIVVSVDEKNECIKVVHTDTSGNPLKVYTSKAPARLFLELARDGAISSISHALDIGSEIEKAYICLKKRLSYIQDKEILHVQDDGIMCGSW